METLNRLKVYLRSHMPKATDNNDNRNDKQQNDNSNGNSNDNSIDNSDMQERLLLPTPFARQDLSWTFSSLAFAMEETTTQPVKREPKPILLLHGGQTQLCAASEYKKPDAPQYKLLNLASPNQEGDRVITNGDVGHEFRIRHDVRTGKIYSIKIEDKHLNKCFKEVLGDSQSVWLAQGEDFQQ